jgi:hypothetical protein
LFHDTHSKEYNILTFFLVMQDHPWHVDIEK